MRRAYTLALSAGSAALILSGAAMAAPPVSYDMWSVTNGDITLDYDPGTAGNQTCPTGFTCGAALVDKGFMQRTLTGNAGTPNAGKQYFQTIVTAQNASGTPSSLVHADESFVLSGTTAATGGIAGKQRVGEAASAANAETAFMTTTELNTGWAQSAGVPRLNLSQSLTQASTGFSNTFSLQQNSDGAGNVTGKNMEVAQSVVLQAGATPDKQVFVLRQVAGDMQGTSHGATPTLLPDGGNITWAAGDEIKAVWIGQDMPSTNQKFGFQSYTQLTPSTADVDPSVSYFSLAETGPWNWQNPPFGTAPTF